MSHRGDASLKGRAKGDLIPSAVRGGEKMRGRLGTVSLVLRDSTSPVEPGVCE